MNLRRGFYTFRHSSIFAANPLASAVAMAAIDVTLSEELPQRSHRLGAQLIERLRSMKTPGVSIRVTGRGLFCALHIDESHPSGRVTAERLSVLMMKRGVIAIPAENRVRIAPPLVITEEDLWKGVEILETALNDLVDLEQV